MVTSCKRDKLIYVAGPISRGNIVENVMRANRAGVALMAAGLSAIVPHGTCFWGNSRLTVPHGDGSESVGFVPEPELGGFVANDFIEMGLATVRRCDAVVRLPGESKGADTEVQEALKHGKLVFYGVEECVAHYSNGGV